MTYRSDKPFIPFYHPVSLDTKMNFGKHKGLTVKRICEIDTGWICWAMENLKMSLDSWAFDYCLQCEEKMQEIPKYNRPENASLVKAYNHKPLGTKEKPLISNKQFKQACERIENGEIDLIEKVRGHFSLEETQEKLLDMYLVTKHLRP